MQARQGAAINIMSRMRREHPREEDPLIEWLAWLMDGSIRIGPWSIGIDPLIGLIPGIGDLAASAVSAVIIAIAIQSGIPKSAIMRMVINVAIDSLLGAIPLVGDAFDFVYKSNARNAEIYRQAVRGQRRQVADLAFVVFVFAILLVVIALPIVSMIYLVRLLLPF